MRDFVPEVSERPFGRGLDERAVFNPLVRIFRALSLRCFLAIGILGEQPSSSEEAHKSAQWEVAKGSSGNESSELKSARDFDTVTSERFLDREVDEDDGGRRSADVLPVALFVERAVSFGDELRLLRPYFRSFPEVVDKEE
jgi:hypothetical protein